MSLLFCNAIEQSEIKDPEIVKILSEAFQGCQEKFWKTQPQHLLSEVELIEIEEDSKQCVWKLVCFECPENFNSKCSGSLNVLLWEVFPVFRGKKPCSVVLSTATNLKLFSTWTAIYLKHLFSHLMHLYPSMWK